MILYKFNNFEWTLDIKFVSSKIYICNFFIYSNFETIVKYLDCFVKIKINLKKLFTL